MERAILVTLLADPAATPAAEANAAGGFQGVAYSGGVVPNFGWSGDMAIDLASLSMPEGEVPVLRNHDPNQIVGHARLANDGKSITVIGGRFSAVTDASRETAALMAEGHPWKLSIAVNGKQQSADRAKPMKLNGREMQLDSVIRNSRVIEFSFVPSGADPNAYAAQLSSRHGIQPSQAGAAEMDDDLQTARDRITELEAQVAALTSERDAARTELAAASAARRNERITALFGATPTLTEAQLAAFRSMSDEQFAAFEATRPQAADPALFQQSATSGRNQEGGGAPATFAAPTGFGVEPERAQLHAKAIQYQAEHAGTDYLTAVRAVSN